LHISHQKEDCYSRGEKISPAKKCVPFHQHDGNKIKPQRRLRGAQPLLHIVSAQKQISAGEESDKKSDAQQTLTDIYRHFFRTVAPLSTKIKYRLKIKVAFFFKEAAYSTFPSIRFLYGMVFSLI
jgi:hypothetical protein